MKGDKKILGAGLVTALASSLCCITPVLALLSGTSGIAATFTWLEPWRPYLIGFTILVLGFAWYQRLKPIEEMDCECDTDKKPPFIQSKLFLGLVTIFALVMTAFPYYSSVFYPTSDKEIAVVNKAFIQTINLEIKGMTCTSCEEHINHSVRQLSGIVNVNASYEDENAKITFDNSLTTMEEIEKAVNATGYTVMNSIKE